MRNKLYRYIVVFISVLFLVNAGIATETEGNKTQVAEEANSEKDTAKQLRKTPLINESELEKVVKKNVHQILIY